MFFSNTAEESMKKGRNRFIMEYNYDFLASQLYIYIYIYIYITDIFLGEDVLIYGVGNGISVQIMGKVICISVYELYLRKVMIQNVLPFSKAYIIEHTELFSLGGTISVWKGAFWISASFIIQ